ncbi:hypothetical protein EVAR_28039_1 [Eumeta japonica]|uniref:CHK kinase-like domain-containing protein n=1 Tax=Eumeta variegata TaxID=151549 RepID=A0A4C1W6C4_EUMVA|nr:hypothetical protein EVAR_28039_1 [Eumeta japonica]
MALQLAAVKMEHTEIAEAVKERTRKILSDGSFENIDIKLESGSKKGDGYVGLMMRGLVSGEKDGSEHEIDVIIKCAPRQEEIRKYMPTTLLFNREILYYSQIVPIYTELQKKFKIPDSLKCEFARCFAAKNEYYDEIIILENLKARDYSMCATSLIDYEHFEISLKVLGHLHGLSYVLEEHNKSQFEQICPQLGDTFFISSLEYNCSGILEFGKKAMNKYLSAIKNNDHVEMVRKAIGENPGVVLKHFFESGHKRCICHGDYWANNLLFKYKDNKPIKAIPLDFQNSRYMSLANDFFYLIALSSDTKLRRNHFWKLLDVYHESLSEFLSFAGIDVNKYCTLEELKTEIREQAIIGLTLDILVLPVFTSDEVIELYEIFAGKYPKNFDIINEDYRTRVNDMVTDYVHFGPWVIVGHDHAPSAPLCYPVAYSEASEDLKPIARPE